MLNKIIPYVDSALAELKYFNMLYGLAEKISSGEEKEPHEFPAVFVGKGNYNQIELETLCCYHRITEKRTFQQLPAEDTRGCAKAFEMTYPMVLVGCMNHSADCEVYETDLMANSVANKMYQVKFPKAMRNELQVFSIELWIKDIDTDRMSIWREEYHNEPAAMTFEKVYFSIKYELKIKGSSECLNIVQC